MDSKLTLAVECWGGYTELQKTLVRVDSLQLAEDVRRWGAREGRLTCWLCGVKKQVWFLHASARRAERCYDESTARSRFWINQTKIESAEGFDDL